MKDIKVLGISGKKQSGKDTAANYIVGVFLQALNIVENFSINESGDLLVTDIFGNKEFAGVLDMDSRHPEFLKFAEENIFPFVKLYSYADLLKQHACIDILGLSWEQCYGSDEQKNTKTHLKWENMPCVITEMLPEVDKNDYEKVAGRIGPYYSKLRNNVIYHKSGNMTAREVMQFIGTEVFRKMYGDVWVSGTLRRITNDAPTMAIIRDVRFINEVNGISNLNSDSDVLNMSGKIIRLTRDIFKGQDQHESETALDKFNWEKCKSSIVVDNKNLNIDQQNKQIHDILTKEKWLPYAIPTELLERLPTK